MFDDLVGIPGLEPGKAGPESAVLPLHHIPLFNREVLVCFSIAMQRYEHFSELANFFSLFFEKSSFFLFPPYLSSNPQPYRM